MPTFRDNSESIGRTPLVRINRLTIPLLAVIVLPILVGQAAAQTIVMSEIFPLDGVPGYPPQQMVDNAGGEFPDAEADIAFTLGSSSTDVEINVRNTVPETHFTVWLKLDGPSPLTGAAVTPLANPSDLAGLAPSTPNANVTPEAEALGLVGDDGSGTTDVLVNAFLTDSEGMGTFSTTLDFRLTDGAEYPFDSFDASLPATPIGDTPFAIRVISHVTDQAGHGLMPGFHEMWFQTSQLAIPEPTSFALACVAVASIGLLLRRK